MSWIPDGDPINDEVMEVVKESCNPIIHVRLKNTDDSKRYPRGGCDSGLGDWWSGVMKQVTCPECLKNYA